MQEPELPRVKRGRPKKVIIDETPIVEDIKTKGRPRSINITDIKEYQKLYYENHKEKTKGNYLCPNCNLYCSVSNKSRHKKKCNNIIL